MLLNRALRTFLLREHSMSEPQSGIQPNVNASEIPSTEKISPNPAASKEAVVPKTATTWSSLQTKWTRFQTGRTYRTYSWTTKNRGKVLLGATALFYGVTYLSSRRRAAKRDKVHDSTYLYWKVGLILHYMSSHIKHFSRCRYTTAALLKPKAVRML